MVLSLHWLRVQASTKGSFLFGRVMTDNNGAIGHSMGAGDNAVAAALTTNPAWAASLGSLPTSEWAFGPATLLNFSRTYPPIGAVFALGMDTLNSPATALNALRSRILFLGGTRDTFSGQTTQEGLFDKASGSRERILAVLHGFTHVRQTGNVQSDPP